MNMQIKNNSAIEISIVGDWSPTAEQALQEVAAFTGKMAKLVNDVTKCTTSVYVECKPEAVDFLAAMLQEKYLIPWVKYEVVPEDVTLTVDMAKAEEFFQGMLDGKY
jgi:hypothetical protein